MTTIQTPSITMTIEAGSPDETGGICYANHVITLKICDKEYELNCWHLCGWLAPGASGDLDGSGLSLWGDNQPGGWRVCNGDGQSRGYIKVDYDTDGIKLDTPDQSIYLSIEDLFPELSKQLNDQLQNDDDDSLEKYNSLVDVCVNELSELSEKIGNEIEHLYDSAEPSEPDSEDIYNELSEIRDLEQLSVKVGNYKDAGPCIAWIDDEDRYCHISHPTERDVNEIVEDVKHVIVLSIMSELDKLNTITY